MDALRKFQARIHQTALDHGWWEPCRQDGTIIALIHSELSEVLEALRNDNPPDPQIPNHDSVSVELADVIIRVLDFAAARDLDVISALQAKAAFNQTRPHRHGGKRF